MSSTTTSDEVPECLICHQRRYGPVFDGRIINGHRLHRCRECHTVFAIEAGDMTEAAPDYASYGDYLIHGDRVAVERAVGREATAKKDILALVQRRFARPRVLELGSGAGYFLRVIGDRGWEAVGVEPSAKLRAYARDEVGVAATVEDLSEVTGSFDVVAMFDVIEHLPPSISRDLLTDLRSRLSPGGYLVGNTPNMRSLNITVTGHRDAVISPPWHTVYFTPESLDRYLTQLGFRRVRLTTRGFSHTEIGRWCRERGGPLLGPALRLVTRAGGRLAGALASPGGMGYQIHFVFDTPTDPT